LRSLSVDLPRGYPGGRVKVLANRRAINSKESVSGTRLTISFADWVEVIAGQKLEVAVV
jgi:hypothetical protein